MRGRCFSDQHIGAHRGPVPVPPGAGLSFDGVLVVFSPLVYCERMTDHGDNLTPADPRDLADALPFALRFQGHKRVHNADEIMAEIVAKRLVEHLERAGFVVMKRPPEIGGR